MGLARTAAIVIGGFPLGERDRVVVLFTRDFGQVRGVARSARRLRSRFAGALELFTLGQLVFFDGGHGELVRIDHFDVVQPFARVREDLDRLGQAAWMVECVGRLTAARDPSPGLYTLLARALRSLEAGVVPGRVAVVFGARLVDLLGHRLRLDPCASCGRRGFRASVPPVIDLEAGGLLCAACGGRRAAGALAISPAALTVLRRVRAGAWNDAVGTPLGRAGFDLRRLLDMHVSRLIGQPPRTVRFLREVERLPATGSGPR
jgi:DNA repair protein RecO (recombination protein O)